jgi:hypothetical protein
MTWFVVMEILFRGEGLQNARDRSRLLKGQDFFRVEGRDWVQIRSVQPVAVAVIWS